MTLNTQITETSDALSRRLGIKSQELQNILGYWMRKSPPNNYEDSIQEISLAWMEQLPSTGGLAFAIARHQVSERWKRLYTRKRKDAINLDEALDDGSGRTQGEFIVDQVNYEALMCEEMDTTRTWAKLPEWVQALVQKKLDGENVNGWRAKQLKEWANANASNLLVKA